MRSLRSRLILGVAIVALVPLALSIPVPMLLLVQAKLLNPAATQPAATRAATRPI